MERRQHVQRSSIFADVDVELTQATYRNLLPSVVISGAALVATFLMLALHYRDRWLWILAAAMFLFAGLRVACVIAFKARGGRALTLRTAHSWQTTYAAITLGYCGSMAVATIYNFRFHDSTSWTLTTIGTFMICAGLTSRVGLRPRILQTCGLILLAALAWAILLSQEPLARVGLLLVVYFGITFYQAVQTKFDAAVEQMRSRRTLRLLADHDPLTGLANRRHFEAALTSVLDAETPFAILFIGLDRFKTVNDAYGHSVGDVLLQRVGVRLKGSVRHGDLVARLGGDEFAILQMAGASQQAAESLARRINRAVAATFEIDGNLVQIGTSVGIRLSTKDDHDATAVLSKADSALYRVKQTGGNGYDTAVGEPQRRAV